jgi:hypothetical protein
MLSVVALSAHREKTSIDRNAIVLVLIVALQKSILNAPYKNYPTLNVIFWYNKAPY